LLTFPEVTDSSNENRAQMTPFSGNVDDIGNDLARVKEMEVDQMIFGLTEPFRPVDRYCKAGFQIC
jgi:hypothetical protein